ncbi:hypothetical protein HYPSUDRAFT_59042 [Hypholoma sublateritium FD-334 SS-4]|uniref:Uncharacterized protein n=1 Tax=Hypholoma sublateritium (strain FD-334 SS-4) TaxID=945553 RepID=A0A0D2P3A5_HYPSF|nr:hypothetical protein HYPSUDRAFT_59042 [Hypholoma sublateritium FD-334 SS-4]
MSAVGLTDTSPDGAASQTSGSEPEPTPAEPIIPRQILAFRTITLLLSQLQKNQNLPYEPYKMSPQESREAKIADAFAHVATAQHDVIAISTRRTPSDLNVVAITENQDGTSTPDIPPAKLTPIFGRFCFTKNSWSREPDPAMRNSSAFPRIVAVTPIVLGSQTLEAYLEELRAKWIPLDLPTHLPVVGELMVKLQERNSTPYEEFMKHTIATCHGKMFRRFEHSWSQVFYRSLSNVTNIPCDNIPCEDSAESQHSYKAQYASDHDFLTGLANIDKHNPEWKLSILIPNLMSITRALPPRGSPLFLYNSNTRVEYHNFLCLILKQFRVHIQNLYKLTTPASQSSTDKQPKPKLPTEPPNIQNLVGDIFVTGYTLWKMARGRSFEIHLKNIQHLLLNPRDILSESTKLAPESDPNVEYNEELETTIPFAEPGRPEPLWKAYRDWTILMIVQFEAASTLRQFVRSPDYDQQPVSVTILLGTPTSNKILPLDDLFVSDFFPGDHKFNKSIGAFIKKALSAKHQYDNCVEALTFWNDKRSTVGPPEMTRKHFCLVILGHMAAMLSADPNKRHAAVFSTVKELLYDWQFHPSIAGTEGGRLVTATLPEVIDRISEVLQAHVDLLCQELDEYGPVPHLKFNFDGSLHCETCLAALLDPLTRQRLAGNLDFKDVMEATEQMVTRDRLRKRSFVSQDSQGLSSESFASGDGNVPGFNDCKNTAPLGKPPV